MGEQVFIILIIFMGLILILLMALIVYLFIKMNENKNIPEAPISTFIQPTKKKLMSNTQLDPTLQMCVNHPEASAQALCAISQDPICDRCVREDDGIIFSLDHFRTYLENKWAEVESVRATADETQASAHLFAFKYHTWKKDQTPSFVTTHYRIDVESDEIESLIKLYVKEEEKDLLKEQLLIFKKNKP